MQKPELYKKTVDILFQAYFNDTLEHANCKACAVGNIVAANIGVRLSHYDSFGRVMPKEWKVGDPRTDTGVWFDAIYDGRVERCLYSEEVDYQVKATGYSAIELARIEYAFESAPTGKSDEDWMFNGLVAVLDVLKEIHMVSDEEASKSVQPFKSHFQTLTNKTA